MGGPFAIDGKVVKCTDNFAQIPFELDGFTWISCEQYFQAAKFTDEAYRARIRDEHDGMRQWMLGQSRKHKALPDWMARRVDVMYRANLAKFQQNTEHAAALLATRGPIAHPGGHVGFWKTWNGRLLERVREELRPEHERDGPLLAERVRMMDEYAAEQRAEAAPGRRCS